MPILVMEFCCTYVIRLTAVLETSEEALCGDRSE